MAREMLCSQPMTSVPRAQRRSVRARCAPTSPFLPSVFAVLAVVASLLTGADAHAQGVPAVAGIVGPVLRLEPTTYTSADSYTTGNPHPGGVPANVINYEDCSAGLLYAFTLALANPTTSYDLVAWAGTGDCTAAAARTESTATCWPLTGGSISQANLGATDAGVPTVTVTTPDAPDRVPSLVARVE